jgi:hypothetical protein
VLKQIQSCIELLTFLGFSRAVLKLLPAQIVKEESHTICKRGSQTLLRKKDYEEFFTFTWEQLNNELKCSFPMLAAVMESVVWDNDNSLQPTWIGNRHLKK